LTRTIKIEGYADFLENTKPAQMIIEDVLETFTITMIHSGPGVGKTGLGFDMVASILTKRDWLGRFKVHTRDAYIFYISQDAARHEIARHSWKIFRKYFGTENVVDYFLVNARFNIIDQQNIKLDCDGGVDVADLITRIKARVEEASSDARLAEQLRTAGVKSEDELLRWSDELVRQNAEPPDAADFTWQEEVPEDLKEDAPRTLPEFQVQPVVDGDKPVIIIMWDVLRRFHAGKESQSDELAPVFEALTRINRELNATSILYHHDNRSGEYKGDTAILGSIDAGFQLVPARGDDPTASVRTLNFDITKPRGIGCRPFVYRMVRENVKTDDESIRFEFVREGQEEVSKRRGKKVRTPSLALVGAGSRLEVARSVWTSGMSQNALGKALRGRGEKIAKNDLQKLHKELQSEERARQGA
jgi:AAA domain